MQLMALFSGNGARAFKDVQEAVRDLLLNKIIVGHSLWNDLLGEEHYLWAIVLLYSFFFGTEVTVHTVLGIPHPAIATRDVALYQPFRNDLPNQSIGLQTLMWQLMRRRVQERTVDAVRIGERHWRAKAFFVVVANAANQQLENARATIDLYRSRATEWESAVSKGKWECQLPPSKFSRYYS